MIKQLPNHDAKQVVSNDLKLFLLSLFPVTSPKFAPNAGRCVVLMHLFIIFYCLVTQLLMQPRTRSSSLHDPFSKFLEGKEATSSSPRFLF
jgi:uncharacterized membrane protein